MTRLKLFQILQFCNFQIILKLLETKTFTLNLKQKPLFDEKINANVKWLQVGGFKYDTVGKMDVANPGAADGNAGLKKRSKHTK